MIGKISSLLFLSAFLLVLPGCSGGDGAVNEQPVGDGSVDEESAGVGAMGGEVLGGGPGGDGSRPLTEEEQRLMAKIEDTGILFWTPEMQLFGYRNSHKISPVRFLEAAADPWPLPEAEKLIEEVRYQFGNEIRGLAYYAEQMHLAGLLVLKDGKIVLEYYGYDNEPSTTWISFSVTKSVLSMLFGAAIRDGYIESVQDDVVRYLPELAESAYEGVTIQQMLTMSSGVSWNEDYTDPESDVAQLEYISSEEQLVTYMASLPRESRAGSVFNYNTGETYLAGALLKAAAGQYLTDYANKRIWQDFGMEHRASWNLLGENELEHGGCCISASLRDYGRVGLLALNGGVDAGGNHILAEDWMRKSVKPSPAFDAYGYFWWLRENSQFAASGIFGQHIYISPEDNLVIAMHGKWPEASGSEYRAHRQAFIEGLIDAARKITR